MLSTSGPLHMLVPMTETLPPPPTFYLLLGLLNSSQVEKKYGSDTLDWITFKKNAHHTHCLIFVIFKGWEEFVRLHLTS